MNIYGQVLVDRWNNGKYEPFDDECYNMSNPDDVRSMAITIRLCQDDFDYGVKIKLVNADDEFNEKN